MLPTHAVGIDLGTTYSCIAYLNEHGEPVTIANHDGELSTPSVVMFDGDQVIVGTEALRNSIRAPERVVQHAKRYMGDPKHRWTIGGRSFTPLDISTHILRQLLSDAKDRIGVVERAVITVPAQFSDLQRQATAEAGRRAGLKHVDIINEPVAAALCFVLGTEGIWFTELATSQMIMVVDLGGGTFDLSLVRYEKNSVRVAASGGDLHLGGIDWNSTLERAIGKQFQREFGVDPLADRESRQALSIEVEQAKRSLSVRPKAALTCQHSGQRKTYQIDVEQFERISKPLVDRMQELTKGLLSDNKMGWAKVDVVLTTGGASRMPMVRQMLKSLSGRTLNTSLSPDQSIAHGATYYAGMLLSNSAFAKSILNETAAARLRQFKQQSVNARALGILVRDVEKHERVPHYLLAASTQLPAEVKTTVGTIKANQPRAHLRVIESGTAADTQYVELGTCLVDPLPPDLPEGSEIEVTIRYDEQARVHVSAKVLKTGQEAHSEIVRPENLLVSALTEGMLEEDVAVKPGAPEVKPILSPVRTTAPAPVVAEFTAAPPTPAPPTKQPAAPVAKPQATSAVPSKRPEPVRAESQNAKLRAALEDADLPIPLCNECGEPLNSRGRCMKCDGGPTRLPPKPVKRLASDELLNLDEPPRKRPATPAAVAKPPPLPAKPAAKPQPRPVTRKDSGEDDFFRLSDD
ncbi:MAG TPA: Hsp70 family protein [Planctomycetaceae bacterium]|nr:Hsp70 family protein [Planctomycetaceae bacterium]